VAQIKAATRRSGKGKIDTTIRPGLPQADELIRDGRSIGHDELLPFTHGYDSGGDGLPQRAGLLSLAVVTMKTAAVEITAETAPTPQSGSSCKCAAIW